MLPHPPPPRRGGGASPRAPPGGPPRTGASPTSPFAPRGAPPAPALTAPLVDTQVPRATRSGLVLGAAETDTMLTPGLIPGEACAALVDCHAWSRATWRPPTSTRLPRVHCPSASAADAARHKQERQPGPPSRAHRMGSGKPRSRSSAANARARLPGGPGRAPDPEEREVAAETAHLRHGLHQERQPEWTAFP